jgi:polysaccharide pyruvyl transferase WcaK-like protein
LYILYFCKKFLKKKVGIYSQSIGNLNPKDQNVFKKYAKHLDFIFTRDEISYRRAERYGLSDNLFLTKDAAFILATSITNKKERPIKKVAISLRSWHHEGRDMTLYFKAINEMVQELLARGFQIDFLSTCQGLENYVDDSQVAKDFVKQYGYGNEKNISIIDRYFTIDQLQQKIKTYDYVFGTRLHMCILALVNGVMAFNISYEEKGKECYQYLGMEDFTVDYNIETINSSLHNFLNMNNDTKEKILKKVLSVSIEQKRVLQDLEHFFSQERNEK